MRDPATELWFDPTDGVVVREAPGHGYGYWVGGKVSYDADTGTFVLFYRERAPLEHGRGSRAAVAVSNDGHAFEDVWEVGKDELAANSIEEGHCVKAGDTWRLYLSYEIRGTSIWRIDLIEAGAPDDFDAQQRRTVLSPGDFGLDWIKDPFLMERDDEWWLYAAAPPRSDAVTKGDFIEAAPLDATVLARSEDGHYFPLIEYVFEAPGDDTWHGRRARINSVMPWDDGFVAFYDGGRTFYDNYEEKAGIALSPDGRLFTRIATDAPWVTSPHGTVRYVCAVPVDDAVFFYYEYTTQSGSHQLRAASVDL